MAFSLLSRGGRAAAFAVLVALAALFAAGCRSASKADAAKAPGEGRGGAGAGRAAEGGPPVPVTTASAVAREVPSYFQATGSLAAEETSDVAPQTSGQVV